MADANPIGDRGPKPQSPGDRFSELGRTITLEAQEEFEAGEWADFDGDGGLVAPADGEGDVILKHDAEEGDTVAAHTGGVVRALDAGPADVVDSLEGDDVLVSF